MSGTETAVFNKYLEIKQDLVNNLREVWNRQHYYTHKYRGNLNTDILVGVDESSEGNKILLVFVRNSKKWIRDELIFNSRGIIKSDITSNLGDE